MYLGSVRFFKHIILTVVVFAIIVPITVSVILAIKYNELKKENEVLAAQVSAQAPDTDEPVSNEEPENTDEPPDTTPDITKDPNLTSGVNSTQAEPEPDVLPAYANLYPEMYAEGYEDEPEPQYADDAGWIYFTFDDGPSSYTDIVLGHLRNYNIPATFFVIPNEDSGRRLNQILAEGHSLGIHCLNHDYNELYASVEDYLDDFKKAYDLVYEQTGYKAEIFRFPGGSMNDYNALIRDEIIQEMTRRGFVYFDWSIDSEDSKGADWTHMYNTVLKGVEQIYDGESRYSRAVILMHDDNINASMTVKTLDDILYAMTNNYRDYKFGKLSKNVRPLQF